MHAHHYPLGWIDTWPRRASQLPTAYTRKLRDMWTLDPLGPAHEIRLQIMNHGRKPLRLFAQLDGVAVEP